MKESSEMACNDNAGSSTPLAALVKATAEQLDTAIGESVDTLDELDQAMVTVVFTADELNSLRLQLSHVHTRLAELGL